MSYTPRQAVAWMKLASEAAARDRAARISDLQLAFHGKSEKVAAFIKQIMGN